MNNIKRVEAGMFAGAAITVPPLVAFAAPAFAATGIGGSGGPHNPSEQHVLVDHASSPSYNLYANSHTFSDALYGGLNQLNAVHCGGGNNC